MNEKENSFTGLIYDQLIGGIENEFNKVSEHLSQLVVWHEIDESMLYISKNLTNIKNINLGQKFDKLLEEANNTGYSSEFDLKINELSTENKDLGIKLTSFENTINSWKDKYEALELEKNAETHRKNNLNNELKAVENLDLRKQVKRFFEPEDTDQEYETGTGMLKALAYAENEVNKAVTGLTVDLLKASTDQGVKDLEALQASFSGNDPEIKIINEFKHVLTSIKLSDYQDLNNMADNLKAENVKFSQTIIELRSALHQKEQSINNLMDVCQRKDLDYTKLLDEATAHDLENKRLRGVVDKLENDISYLMPREEYNKLSKLYEKSLDENGELKQKNEILRNDIFRGRGGNNVEKYKAKILELEKCLSDRNYTIKDKSNSLTVAWDKIAKLENENYKYRYEREAGLVPLSELEACIKSNCDLNDKLDLRNTENKELKQLISKYENELEEITETARVTIKNLLQLFS